jgi:hypothetical protein
MAADHNLHARRKFFLAKKPRNTSRIFYSSYRIDEYYNAATDTYEFTKRGK